MFQTVTYPNDPDKFYTLLLQQAKALTEGETDDIAILSNLSALLGQGLAEINWVGFYRYMNGELLLGPFQGLPACVHIPIGKGVCGTAARTLQTQRVEDVHLFPGHIACDGASESEIVIPMVVNNELYGVLDIDAPVKNRFTETDRQYLERFVKDLCDYIEKK
ncbi:MAG: GAF domain-containing protein [Erysipelotrichaceae bacterium]|mgnify:FL=1|nr:GAF domain-containing protein [Erysipelotrichaceae bacterium]